MVQAIDALAAMKARRGRRVYLLAPALSEQERSGGPRRPPRRPWCDCWARCPARAQAAEQLCRTGPAITSSSGCA